MIDRFGPWSSALGDGPARRLDTFWKRRLTLLPASRSARLGLRWRDRLALSLIALTILGLPTIHLATAQGPPSSKSPDRGKIYVRANFSPQGTLDPGLSGLWAIDPVTADRTKLAEDFFFDVRVSPDRKTIALSRSGWATKGRPVEDVGTWTIAADGRGERRKIADFGGAISWSPDSKQLIVSYGTTPIVDGREIKLHETWRMEADGSGKSRLPIPASDSVADWSIDGQWVVTVSDRQEPKFPNYQIYVMHLDGSEQRLISSGKGGNVYPRFSPDGKQVASYFWAKGDDGQIEIVNTDGTGRRVLVKTSPTAALDHLAWSPDGRSIAYRVQTPRIDPADGHFSFMVGEGNPRLSIIDVDGTNLRTLGTPHATWLEEPDWR